MCNVPHFYNFFFPRLRSTSFNTSSFYNAPIWCKQLYHSQPLDDDQRGDAVFRDLAAPIVHGGHGNLRDCAALPEAQHKVPMPPRKESRSGPSASHAGKSHRIDPGLEKVIFLQRFSEARETALARRIQIFKIIALRIGIVHVGAARASKGLFSTVENSPFGIRCAMCGGSQRSWTQSEKYIPLTEHSPRCRVLNVP